MACRAPSASAPLRDRPGGRRGGCCDTRARCQRNHLVWFRKWHGRLARTGRLAARFAAVENDAAYVLNERAETLLAFPEAPLDLFPDRHIGVGSNGASVRRPIGPHLYYATIRQGDLNRLARR